LPRPYSASDLRAEVLIDGDGGSKGDMAGERVPGYTELRSLGSGASGSVVLATSEMTGAPVAVKYLSDSLIADSGFLDRYQEDVRLLAELTEPNLCRIHSYVTAAHAVVMDYVPGASLLRILRRTGPTSTEASLVVLTGSLYALAAAHSVGVIHRDHKPGNVLVNLDGDVRLVDVGIAMPQTRDPAVTGTPPYLAPELWAGRPASAASDVYAAVAVFVECLTGRPPYAGHDLPTLRREHERSPAPVDGVPLDLRRVVARGLAKDADSRPADGRLLAAELQAVALTGYGPDWEEHGRAELALVAAAAAASSTPRANRVHRSRVLRASRWRRRRPARPETVG
jgi:serine/threonine-protein kinase